MALKTSQEYLESVKKLSPKVYVGGKWVSSLLDHPITRSMVMANAAIYDLAQQEPFQNVMVATSHLTGTRSTETLTSAAAITIWTCGRKWPCLPARRLAPATTAASAATH